jgi:hypothetical protein
MPEEYERTIAGLLKKRSEMVNEMHSLRERMGVVSNDLQSLDRVLQAFGFDEPLDQLPVAKSKVVLFHKSELQHQLLAVLRQADRPMSSRDLAVQIVTSEGRDRYDKRLVLDLIKRVGKSIATLRYRGLVSGCRDSTGRFLWQLTKSGRLPEA